MYEPGILRILELTALILMARHIVIRIAEYLRREEESEFDLEGILADLPEQPGCVYREKEPSNPDAIRQTRQEATLAC